MPSSLAARNTRMAISERLATRMPAECSSHRCDLLYRVRTGSDHLNRRTFSVSPCTRDIYTF